MGETTEAYAASIQLIGTLRDIADRNTAEDYGQVLTTAVATLTLLAGTIIPDMAAALGKDSDEINRMITTALAATDDDQ